MVTKRCPFCAEEIHSDAIKCKHCGEILDADLRESRNKMAQPTFIVPQQNIRKWSPGVAALITLFIPGAGHLYKGNVGAGILWFIAALFGYIMFIIPGIFIHIICIFSAASGDPYK
jgi:TM2 domain-containing membrane protein YozV/predicted nucleic acid-binding Zn ribbon protein